MKTRLTKCNVWSKCLHQHYLGDIIDQRFFLYDYLIEFKNYSALLNRWKTVTMDVEFNELKLWDAVCFYSPPPFLLTFPSFRFIPSSSLPHPLWSVFIYYNYMPNFKAIRFSLHLIFLKNIAIATVMQCTESCWLVRLAMKRIGSDELIAMRATAKKFLWRN